MSNDTMEERLFKAIERERLPHAVLITGPEGSAGDELAKRAAALYCTGKQDADRLSNCPDYFPLGPEAIPVDAVRSLQLKLVERSFSGRRAAVLFGAHHMNANAQNALLKTLEEPPANTLMLLIGTEEGLLPTIRSRCTIVRLGARSNAEIVQLLKMEGAREDVAVFAAWLSGGAKNLAQILCTEDRFQFFKKAAPLFFKQTMTKLPLYEEAAALLDSIDLAPKEARSKGAKARPAAALMIDIFLMLADDVLRCLLGRGPGALHPMGAALSSSSQNFTIRRIQGIIELLLSAKIRVAAANPSLTIDVLLTELSADAH
ncbi:hypothetical protein LJC27_00105 [Christensenellaceae bacterium OttesenSCG-928-M15]|nr:hypothetical protein [Christensenellaceae bacterium OttesenSCG-928-M15]